MRKSIAVIIDELIIVNIKSYLLNEEVKRRKHTRVDVQKLQDLNSFRAELCNALNQKHKVGMKKNISTVIDELISTNIKIYHLVEKVQNDEHTREEAKKIQDLNSFRAELCNVLNKEYKDRKIIKL